MIEPPIPRILAVDDDPTVLVTVRATLEAENLNVMSAFSTEEALSLIRAKGLPHLAVIDINMPGADGIELARRLQEFSDVPVVMLTAVDDQDTVAGTIEELAEDYIVKPFNPREFAARVKRVLRRIGDFAFTSGRIKVSEELELDFALQQAIVKDEKVSLTPTETKILHILCRSSPRPSTTHFLLRRLWPHEDIFEDVLRVHVHRLRRKIEANPRKPRYLITERGIGYRLVLS